MRNKPMVQGLLVLATVLCSPVFAADKAAVTGTPEESCRQEATDLNISAAKLEDYVKACSNRFTASAKVAAIKSESAAAMYAKKHNQSAVKPKPASTLK